MKKHFAVLVLALLAGCATNKPQTAKALGVSRIAVLPTHNETKSPEGALLMRDLVTRWMTERGYVTVPQSIVDRELAAMNVSDVASLTLSQMRTLSERTGANALAAVDLLDFAVVNRGFSHERRVAAAVRLVQPSTGDVIWQNTDTESNKSSTKNPTVALYDYARTWGTQQLENALKSPLFPESNKLVTRLLKNLPTYQPS